MAEPSGATASESAPKLTLTIELASFVLLVLYLAVNALQQSDVELVLPSSKFNVGGVLEQFKEGIPGGAFVAPILKVQVPLALFYTVSPILLVLLHALVVLRRELLSDAPPPLRFLAIWLPPATIALIRWRFAPFVGARPKPPLAGQALEGLHTLALFADAAVVTFALLPGIGGLDLPGADARLHALRLRAVRHGILVAVVAFLVTQPLHHIIAAEARSDARSDAASSPVASAVAFVAGAGLLVTWLFGTGGPARRPRPVARDRPNLSSTNTEDLDMTKRIALAAGFILFVALPTVAHGLDFSGENLVARAPSETVVAAIITAKHKVPGDLPDLQKEAWAHYGRGIYLVDWKFPYASFKGATMALIKLNHATLTSASFDHADLTLAELNDVHAAGASFRLAELVGAHLSGADLSGSDLSGADLRQANLGGANRVAQASDAKSVSPTQNDAEKKGTPTWDGPVYCKDKHPTIFANAHLQGANLEAANLTCANLRGATLDQDTKIDNATVLDHADFCGAHLNGVDLRKAKSVKTARFSWADIRNAKLPVDNPPGSENSEILYADHAYVADATFLGSHLERADLRGLNLSVDEANGPKADHTKECDKTPQAAPG